MKKFVFDLFKDQEIYLVGGSVRDQLLGKECEDLDFAIDCRPKETKQILNSAKIKTYDVGMAFGTIGFFKNNTPIEITTYRKDEKYNRGSRLPEVSWGDSLLDDLKRRDFTINAIAEDKEGNIYDAFGGLKDLGKKIIRTPLDPKVSFSDDPLRMLRAVRFACQLGFDIETKTVDTIYNMADAVLELSAERIQMEFSKILLSNDPVRGIKLLKETRLLNFIIPELLPLEKVEQDNKFHHKDAWGHTMGVLDNLKGESLELVLAGTFHDLAKPYTRTIKGGNIHFYRHEDLGAILTRGVLKRLKYSNEVINKVCFLVENHMRANLYHSGWKNGAIRRFVRDMEGKIQSLLKLSRADITSHNPNRVSSGIARIDELERRIANLKAEVKIESPISGEDIMRKFDLEPCKIVGELKKKIIEAILDGVLAVDSNKEECLGYLEKRGLDTF